MFDNISCYLKPYRKESKIDDNRGKKTLVWNEMNSVLYSFYHYYFEYYFVQTFKWVYRMIIPAGINRGNRIQKKEVKQSDT